MKFTVNGKDIEVTYKFTGKLCNFNGAYSGHNVTVSVDDNKTSFEFFGSIAKPQCTVEDIPFMLYCFVSDALYYRDNDSQEFCNMLGYNFIQGKKVYNACRRSYEKTQQISLDLEVVIEYLQENYEL